MRQGCVKQRHLPPTSPALPSAHRSTGLRTAAEACAYCRARALLSIRRNCQCTDPRSCRSAPLDPPPGSWRVGDTELSARVAAMLVSEHALLWIRRPPLAMHAAPARSATPSLRPALPVPRLRVCAPRFRCPESESAPCGGSVRTLWRVRVGAPSLVACAFPPWQGAPPPPPLSPSLPAYRSTLPTRRRRAAAS